MAFEIEKGIPDAEDSLSVLKYIVKIINTLN